MLCYGFRDKGFRVVVNLKSLRPETFLRQYVFESVFTSNIFPILALPNALIMAKKLKRDQLPSKQAENWRKSFKEEAKLTFNLKVSQIILQKATYKTLIGENENRVRVYLGLEQKKDGDNYVLCAFAVSAFLLGSGDVYADYETPVFKLEKENINCSDNTEEVIESIRLYRKWRAGELDEIDAGAPYRQYIYPHGYLLTKSELHELFNVQNNDEIQIEFGVSKTMNVMLTAVPSVTMLTSAGVEDGEEEVFDLAGPCPPDCDERSIYNS